MNFMGGKPGNENWKAFYFTIVSKINKTQLKKTEEILSQQLQNLCMWLSGLWLRDNRETNINL